MAREVLFTTGQDNIPETIILFKYRARSQESPAVQIIQGSMTASIHKNCLNPWPSWERSSGSFRCRKIHIWKEKEDIFYGRLAIFFPMAAV